MAFKKGESGNPSGRPNGAVNKRTEMWNQLGEYVVTSGAQRAMTILGDMDDEDFLHYYLTMLEYFKPKQARQTIVGENDAPVQIIINDKL
jgi:hypothetical protein